MKLKSTLILNIFIQADSEGTVTLTGEIGTVKMIPFKGTVTGPLFSGIVEPCGVDTQIINQIRNIFEKITIKNPCICCSTRFCFFDE